jgi:uncharacterized damage-inducible protein DinB
VVLKDRMEDRDASNADGGVLDALLDSWDRNNAIMVNLLRALPEGGLDVRPMEGSATVAEMYGHMHYIRLVHVFEDAPELAGEVPDEWVAERDPDALARKLEDSARRVRDAVRGRLEAGRPMDTHYDHPILMIQHILWHEAYHHGQIKLALKLAGRPIGDDVIGEGSWGVWMDKR